MASPNLLIHGVTRYDFLKAYPAVYPDQIWEGWKVMAHNAVNTLLLESEPGEEFDPEPMLEQLRARRWVVARWGPHHIRSWHGDNLPVTRVDILLRPEGWRVRKWLAGWMPNNDPVSDVLKPSSWSPDEAFAWFKQRVITDTEDCEGWRLRFVRQGHKFFFLRAWKGIQRPVRNAGKISRMRKEFVRYRADMNPEKKFPQGLPRPEWLPEGISFNDIEFMDLAYLM